MKTDTKISAKKSWAKALARPAAEFPLTQLSVKSGKIPEGLRGTLYRNGPARLERGGMNAGHWFDGDGAFWQYILPMPVLLLFIATCRQRDIKLRKNLINFYTLITA